MAYIIRLHYIRLKSPLRLRHWRPLSVKMQQRSVIVRERNDKRELSSIMNISHQICRMSTLCACHVYIPGGLCARRGLRNRTAVTLRGFSTTARLLRYGKRQSNDAAMCERDRCAILARVHHHHHHHHHRCCCCRGHS